MDDDRKNAKNAIDHGIVYGAGPGRIGPDGEGDWVRLEFEDGSIGWIRGHLARLSGYTPEYAEPQPPEQAVA